MPACVIIGLGCATQSQASVINNIGGINYEWLEISNTVNLSRTTVESCSLIQPVHSMDTDTLHELKHRHCLNAYMPYVPAEINHCGAYLAPGAQAFFNEFGITHIDPFGATYQATSDDGVTFDYNMYMRNYFGYGATGECGVDFSCVGRMLTAALDGDFQTQFTPARRDFDATWAAPDQFSVYDTSPIAGSLLVRELITVPAPALPVLVANLTQPNKLQSH